MDLFLSWISPIIFASQFLYSTHALDSLRHVDARSRGLSFGGEGGGGGGADHFRLLQMDGAHLLIGARDMVYDIDVRNFTFRRMIHWPAEEREHEICTMKGNDKEVCHNYIRVLALTEGRGVVVCGTNAYDPKCRSYNLNKDGTYRMEHDFDGKGISPFDPNHNSTAVFVPQTNEIYTGTVADFQGKDALIYRKNIDKLKDIGVRTERNDIKCLNEPNFVGSFEDEGYVYFWLREDAVEYSNCGKAIYSRVARICKNDQGGPRSHSETWTTFLKARLNCSLPGDYPFYFDEIESISNLVEENGGAPDSQLVYAVFNTPYASIRSSAVCAFRMEDLRRVFSTSPFKSQHRPHSSWQSVLKSKVPVPRPGTCSNDSRSLRDEAVTFILANPLMHDSVQNYQQSPVFIQTGLDDRLTKIAVDSEVSAPDGTKYDVLFIATESGRILKVVNLGQGVGSYSFQEPFSGNSVIVEISEIFDKKDVIESLLVYREPMIENSSNIKEREAYLLAVGGGSVRRLPLHNCERATTCWDCVQLRDPYCAWDLQANICASRSSGRWPLGTVLQNVETGVAACPQTGNDAPRETRPPISPEVELPLVVSERKERCDCHKTSSSPSASSSTLLVASAITTGNELDQDSPSGPATQIEAKAAHPSGIRSAQTLAIAVIASFVGALLIGFAAGYQCSQRDCLRRRKDISRMPSGASGYQQSTVIHNASLSTLQRRSAQSIALSRTGSKLTSPINAYESTPKFNGAPHSVPPLPDPTVTHVLDLDDDSSLKDKNYLMEVSNFNSSTLPRDYKVKKMYL